MITLSENIVYIGNKDRTFRSRYGINASCFYQKEASLFFLYLMRLSTDYSHQNN